MTKGPKLNFPVVICALLVIAGGLFVYVTHFNFVSGVYTYDPRTGQPSRFVLANRPDLVLIDALTKQIAREGTYPPNAKVNVLNLAPLRVAVSTYTDFQAYAFVTTRLSYADGTSRIEEFRFHSVGSEGIELPLLGAITFHALYGRLAECQEMPGEPAGKSVCRLQ